MGRHDVRQVVVVVSDQSLVDHGALLVAANCAGAWPL